MRLESACESWSSLLSSRKFNILIIYYLLLISSQDSQLAYLESGEATKTFFFHSDLREVSMLERLIDFMNSELQIPTGAISLAKKQETVEPHTLPIILWQYGLLNTEQLDRVFDWLEIS